MALESVGITRGFGVWGASKGGFGECVHHQGLWRVGASPGGSGVWGAYPGGFGEWGHLQVALESGGIYRWLWRVRASPGALESGGITMGFGE